MQDVEMLLRILYDGDLEAQLNAIISLGRLADPNALEAVLAIMVEAQKHDDDAYNELLEEAIFTLGQLGERKAIPHLRSIMNNKQFSIYIKEKAAQSLGKLGDRDFLQECLTSEDEIIRAGGLSGLLSTAT